MKFTKMQGCGNDYIYVNCFEEKIDDPAKAAILLSDRHFGIGADGLICICPSDKADFCMDMYNADGSQGKMCGNGIRCLAKYVYDHGMTGKSALAVETPAGIRNLKLNIEDGRVKSVRVDMGRPEFDPHRIPYYCPDHDFEGQKSRSAGQQGTIIINKEGEAENISFAFTALSMGNPHAVVRVDDTDGLEAEKIGPAFEKNEAFPEGVNTEFIEIVDEKNIKMRVWERGSGETLACGTGACAAAVVGFLNGWTQRNVTVHLPGGALEIEYAGDGTVYLTGPAQEVFSGEWK